MAVWEQNHPYGKIFRILLLKFNRGHRLTFFPNFIPICPVRKKKTSLYPLLKINTHLFATISRPFSQGAKILMREISTRPTYACKILSWSVRVCRSYLRKPDFEQHITLSRMHHSVQYKELNFVFYILHILFTGLFRCCFFRTVVHSVNRILLWVIDL